ncbi:hypothetical protein C0Q70_07825 [Pomacea canaliculata]|uniref:Very-long-chain (3R)-3-hydroxyacyl-CoA dehydratase n=1 Tax=Pomacea canaliculata TaxID=400727 RepID=A0A2T7PG65_POMCA|nr:hypothetical protein C0Q70_07825 [Pomacea canaliculata]
MPASIDHRKQAKSLGDSAVVKGYLIAYNVSQMLGWIILMFMIVCHIYREGNVTLLYKEVEQVLLIFQTAAVLEIVHSSLGLVKSNPILTTFQVFSRVFLLWGVVWSVPQVQTEVYVFYFLIAWTITEIIRYSFYFFSLLGGVPYTLKWCRYTLFIALYPVGVMEGGKRAVPLLPVVFEAKEQHEKNDPFTAIFGMTAQKPVLE